MSNTKGRRISNKACHRQQGIQSLEGDNQKECKLELVLPGCHQQNLAEVAIKTFKEHFIATLAGLPTSFPIHLWWELLSHAELTLNILCLSYAQPNVSAQAYLFGPFDFDHTPLAPIGCTM